MQTRSQVVTNNGAGARLPVFISDFVRVEPTVVSQEECQHRLMEGRVKVYKMLNPYCVTPSTYQGIAYVFSILALLSSVAVFQEVVTLRYCLFAFGALGSLFFIGLNVWSFYAEGKMRSIMATGMSKINLGPGVINTRRLFVPEGNEEQTKINAYEAILDLSKGPYAQDNTARSAQYSKIANKILHTIYNETSVEEAPANLIHTTCSGYVSPAPNQVLVSEKGWNTNTTCSQVYHMGCAASIPSVRTAKSFVLDTGKKCDVVHTELLCMHSKPSLLNPVQLFFENLFADGAIKYSLSHEVPTNGGFEVLSTHEMIVPESLGSMTWIVANNGFEMSLSRKVPDELVACLDVFMAELNRRAGIEHFDPDSAIFAIHPGGPKIVTGIAKHFNLKPHQFHYSWKVLLERGNISSGTMPHIWEQVLLDPAVPKGTIVYSIGAAPGLTLAGACYRKH